MKQDSTKKRRTRNDPRRDQTRVAIIEKAEQLFAEHGIDGVSLRQIGTAVGSGNTSVVAYHFGSKEALVHAIFHYRLTAIDTRREQLMRESGSPDDGDEIGRVVRAMWLPLFEQTDQQGRHSYAGFASALMRSGWAESRVAVDADYPVTNALLARLQSLLPEDIRPRFTHRLNITAVIITGALSLIDRTCAGEDRAVRSKAIFEDALGMARAAMLAAAPGA